MLKATLIGNLGSDPELRYSASGSPFLRFNVAANSRTRTPVGEWVDRVEWIRCTVIGQRAETLSRYLRKGSRVYVEGRLEARPRTDQQGQLRAGLEVLANEVQFMSARSGVSDAAATTSASVADERSARRIPQDVAVHGIPGGTAVADRDRDDFEDLP
jgi:single-strand DNA-binding protein